MMRLSLAAPAVLLIAGCATGSPDLAPADAAAPPVAAPPPQEPAGPDNTVPAQPEDPKIEEAVKRLLDEFNSDNPESRDRARLELLKLGPPALPALKRLLQKIDDADFKAEATTIVNRIEMVARAEKFGGGNLVAGFMMRLVTPGDKKSFKAGEKFEISLEIMNASSTINEFVTIKWWDMNSPRRDVIDSGSQACVSVKQVSGDQGGGGSSSRIGRGGPDLMATTVLKAGESRAHAIVINGSAQSDDVRRFGGVVQTADDKPQISLTPGEYEITVTYYAEKKSLLKGAAEDMTSNTLKIKIE